MTPLDRFIRALRVRQISKFVPEDCTLLDVGCFDGYLFSCFASRIRRGVGVEPLQTSPLPDLPEQFEFLRGTFPEVLPSQTQSEFDIVTMLAVVEHFPEETLPAVVAACHRVLRAKGRVLITVPSPLTDHVLAVLSALRLIDGMSLEQHHGFDPSSLRRYFSERDWILVASKKFQFGLNNLFVFEKRS